MTRLCVQICALNERENIGDVIREIPREIDRIADVRIVVVDDGSADGTGEVARSAGADMVVRHNTWKGLARAFQTGIDNCLAQGADIVVNIDADGQYRGADIPRLIAPIVSGQADVVVGDRRANTLAHFSAVKRAFQWLGSAVVRQASGVAVADAVSGFRAYERDAALRLFVSTRFSYTVQSIIQAGKLGLRIVSVPIDARETSRPSRLHKGIAHFISQQASILIRTYATYEPLKTFGALAVPFLLVGAGLFVRALILAQERGGQVANVPSLLAGGFSILIGLLSIVTGIIADRIYENRRILEEMLYRLRKEQSRPQQPNALPAGAAQGSPQSPRSTTPG